MAAEVKQEPELELEEACLWLVQQLLPMLDVRACTPHCVRGTLTVEQASCEAQARDAPQPLLLSAAAVTDLTRALAC